MKNLIIYLNLFILFILFSCNKEEHIAYPISSTPLELRASGGTESQIASFYSYQVSLGKQYHQWMLSLIKPYDWNLLSNSDKNAILNFTDPQFAALAIYYEGVAYGILPPNYYSTPMQNSNSNIIEMNRISPQYVIDPNAIQDCLSFATGYSAIREVLNLSSLNAAVISQSAVKILKTVGRRYLGWIGVALMVADFYDCMSHF